MVCTSVRERVVLLKACTWESKRSEFKFHFYFLLLACF